VQCESLSQRCHWVSYTNPNRHGEAHRHFSAIIGWDGLTDAVKEFGEENEFTKLVVDLKGKDPDDAFSKVPYEKGFIFLFYLENLLSKESFDKFIPHVSELLPPLIATY
jgi:leukotriene-A4 hydrolase